MAPEHYFSRSPQSDSGTLTVRVRLAGKDRELVTAPGVFSGDQLDRGTKVLLNSVPQPPASGHLLDLGTGWGPIGLSLALQSPDATVWAVDVNERALQLVRSNARRLSLDNVRAVLPDEVPENLRFATIWSNPPIRVGKPELHAMLIHWLSRLETDATAWLVVAKQLGADSLQRWIASELNLTVTRANTSGGFRVFAAHA